MSSRNHEDRISNLKQRKNELMQEVTRITSLLSSDSEEDVLRGLNGLKAISYQKRFAHHCHPIVALIGHHLATYDERKSELIW